MAASESDNERPTADGQNVAPDWIVDIEWTLGCIYNTRVKACSIPRVPDKFRGAKDKERASPKEIKERERADCYRPQFVSIGPLHWGTRIDLQIMEETKWRYMHALIIRRAKSGKNILRNCSEAIRKIDGFVRASYGDQIELESEKLARIMVLDGCFFLEFLYRLYDGVNKKIEPSLDYISNKTLPVLTDLTLLENQIPFVVLKVLADQLSKADGQNKDKALSQEDGRELEEPPQEDGQEKEKELCREDTPYEFPSLEQLAESLFEYKVANAGFGVYHFLNLMHLSSPDPYENIEAVKKGARELKRCARKLQAFGIKIRSSQTMVCEGNVGVI